LPGSTFYGSYNRQQINVTISSNTLNYDVWANVNNNGLYAPGASDITVTVNPGVYVGGPGGYAMQIPASFNAGDTVTLVNNGYILGYGGGGGGGGNNGGGAGGGNAGNALYINRPVTIYNNGNISAGGGGGGGGGGNRVPQGKGGVNYQGGGGGGGAGYNAGGGAGSGGSPGSFTCGGAGGGGTGSNANPGGPGGALGSPGASSPGGAGGGSTAAYIVGNPFATWAVTGTRNGNVS
jgi:hypothetical protein